MIPKELENGSASENGPFAGCVNLKTAKLASRAHSVAPGLFAGCTGLESVSMPDTVSEISAYAFYNCSALKKIPLLKRLYSIGDYAFYGCGNLEGIEFGDDTETVGRYAFYNCSALKRLELPSEIRMIPRYCFYGAGVETALIGNHVTSIESCAFADTASLTEVTIPGSVLSISNDAFNHEAGALTVTGAKNSTAEAYAEEKGYVFKTGTTAESLMLSTDSLNISMETRDAYITAEFLPADAMDAIFWECGDEEIARIAQDAADPAVVKISPVSQGTTTVTATMGSISQSCKVTVGDYLSKIAISPTSVVFKSFTETKQLSAVCTPSTAEEDVIWVSADERVAKVDQTGLVTPVGNGSVRITAKSRGNDKIRGYCFVVVNPDIPITDFNLNQTELLMSANGTYQLKAEVMPSNANGSITWSSTDESVVSVNQKGLVKTIHEGNAVIRAMAGDIIKECTVTVIDADVPVTGIELEETEAELNSVSKTIQLHAQVLPEDATIQGVSYTSSDERIVKVDASGLVTGQGAGTALITAETNDGAYQAVCKVSVICLIDSITLNQSRIVLVKGETAELEASIFPELVTNSELEWYSTNTRVASVDENGAVTAEGAGTAYIRCAATDGTGVKATCLVKVKETADSPEPEDPEGDKKEPDKEPDQKPPSGTGEGENPGGISKPPVSSGNNGQNKIETVKKPARATIKKAAAKGKKKLAVKWKKIKGVSGYRIQYSLKKKFPAKSTVTRTVKGKNAVSVTLKGLKSKKKYYVRVQAYNTGKVSGKSKTVYGKWSAVKSAKTK